MAKTLPTFESEQEEAEFWDTHDSTDFVDDTEAVVVKLVDARPRKRLISLRIDADTIEMLKGHCRPQRHRLPDAHPHVGDGATGKRGEGGLVLGSDLRQCYCGIERDRRLGCPP